jgi:hypothetical protein
MGGEGVGRGHYEGDMNLDEFAQKLARIAEQMKAEKGAIELFGLFQRENSLDDLWDLVISAPWLKSGGREPYEYVVGHLRPKLAHEELASLSRIVILDHGGTVSQQFLDRFQDRSGLMDVHLVTEGGAVIRRAYIILAQSIASQNGQKTKKSRRKKVHARNAP